MANKNFEVKHGLSVGGTERITAAGAGSLTNLTLSGNLTVQGTTVTLDASTLQVADKNLVLNYHASNDTSSAANGAGITIQDAVDGSNDATLTWDTSLDKFDLSHGLHIGDSAAIGTTTTPALQIGGTTTYRLGLYTSAEGGVIENKNGDDGLQFKVKTAGEVMRLNTSGKLGISTTASLSGSDYGMLTIKKTGSNIFGDSAITINSADTNQSTLALGLTSSLAYVDSTESGSGTVLPLVFATGSSEKMRIDSSGNVLIGQTSIASTLGDFAQLEVSHATAGGIIINTQTAGSSNYCRLMFSKGNNQGNEGVIRYNTSDYHMGFWTDAAERMRIDSRGAIGFGTTPPSDTHTGWNQIFVGQKGSIISENATGTHGYDGMLISDNLYVDTDTGAFANIETNESSLYMQEAGVHKFYSQASGSAGAAVTLSERMRIDSAGTIYQGTTTPTLHSAVTGIVFQNGSLITDFDRAASRSITLAQNAAVDSGNTWAYLATDEASYYQQFNGNHYFATAPSGSAGADVTFNTKMMIHNSGNVTIGDGASNIDIGIGNTGTVGHLGRTGSGALIHLGGDDCQVRLANSILHHDNSGNTNLYLRNHYTTLGNDNNAKVTLEAGKIVFATSTGYLRAMEIGSNGACHTAYTGSADTSGYFYAGKDWGAGNHRINRAVTQGNLILVVSAYNSSGQDTALFYGCSGQDANSQSAGLRMQKNSSNNRSINAAGTINASGSDYAEYVIKSDTCGAIAKGDICGIDANSKITDKWSEAHSFVVKSTDPSYVGGDSWGTLTRPELTLQGYADPDNPADETDSEYATRTTQHETDLAAFETALEAERVKYDRIAFSGQVPCNLTGASVGDYIIPKEGTSDAITGEAVSTPTFEQYQKAVGKVWKVLDNGNAWISVKIG